MPKNKRLWVFVLAVGLVLSLLLIFWPFVYSLLIQPLTLLLWAFWRVLASAHQSLYWVLLIIVSLILIFRSFPLASLADYDSAYPESGPVVGRIEYWQSLLASARQGEDGLLAYRQSLRRLLVASLAQQARLDPADVETALASGGLSLPPSLRSLVAPPDAIAGTASEKLRLRLFFILPRWARKLFPHPFPQQDGRTLSLLEWIESDLEINHDN